MGLTLTAFEGFEPTSRGAARKKYRTRAWAAYFAFLSAVLSATFGLIGVGTRHISVWPDVVGVILLGLAAFLVASIGFVSLLEMER